MVNNKKNGHIREEFNEAYEGNGYPFVIESPVSWVVVVVFRLPFVFDMLGGRDISGVSISLTWFE